MGVRVLDWNGLLEVAGRRNPPDRLITVAGLPARVMPTPRRDPGFYVRTVEDLGPGEAWELRVPPAIILLRELVAAGQVTVRDDGDRWRMVEWQALLADTGRGCYVYGCTAADIDERGPVFDDQERMHKACPAHWEGVYAVLGAQDAEDPEVVEVLSMESREPVRVLCAVCGADAERPHDPDLHMNRAAAELWRN